MNQIVLIVLDGWGFREDPKHNAIAAARTPVFKRLWQEYPHTLLEASGLAVGLPERQMGNSEIGHTTIGAGTVIDTDLVRIAKAIANNEFISNSAFVRLFEQVKKHTSTLHVCGLLGTGGVHAHSDHLFAFLRAAKKAGLAPTQVALHLFTDGRDTPPQSAAGFLEDVERVLADVGVGQIASIAGRFYAMDRDNNWDRLKHVEDILFSGADSLNKPHPLQHEKPAAVIRGLYAGGKLDEHLEPILFDSSAYIRKNDGVFFFNFRADRARQLSRKIIERRDSHAIYFVTMTEYEKDLGADVAFPQTPTQTTLAAEISRAGLSQAHIAETEKFPHATYFLNGGREEPHPGEVHILLPSRKDVPTHDLAPKMRAEGIADRAIEEIGKGTNFIFINFANPDMVGHTANVPAIIEAVEETDTQLGRVMAALEKSGGVAFITADHGNAEVNIDPVTGDKHTSHTINPVPAILTLKKYHLATAGGLADIAPTVLAILDIPQPAPMTGKSLLE